MDIDFFKERHDIQIERGGRTDDKVKTSMTAISLIVAVLAYFSGKFTGQGVAQLWVFWFPFLLAAAFIVVSIFYIVRVYFLPERIDLAPADMWLEHFNNLKTKHTSTVGKEQSVANEFTIDLTEKYAEAATHNQRINDRIGYNIQQANKFIIFALWATLASGPAFFYWTQSGATPAASTSK